ncbi:MAG: hypothetical protein JSR80_01845 [Verrucomicrobia bacterium]|nr:hypothetical protein [Verrucomicrobiota bacterium]
MHFASELQLPKTLKGLGFSEKEIALSLGSILGRAIFPSSERATYDWLLQTSALGELLNFDFANTTLDHLYAISDKLLKHKEELEKHFVEAQQTLHGYRSTLILYDLSNNLSFGFFSLTFRGFGKNCEIFDAKSL